MKLLMKLLMLILSGVGLAMSFLGMYILVFEEDNSSYTIILLVIGLSILFGSLAVVLLQFRNPERDKTKYKPHHPRLDPGPPPGGPPLIIKA